MMHKTLSEKQPWSYLLCAGIKDIENRTWPLPEKYRNEWVLIHSSSKSAGLYFNNGVFTSEQLNYLIQTRKINLIDTVVNSAITGAVKFTDCVINHPSIWAEKSMQMKKPLEQNYFSVRGNFDTDGFYRDLETYQYQKPIYNWVVSDAILFYNPILNVKGKLSFWNFDLPEEYVKLLK